MNRLLRLIRSAWHDASPWIAPTFCAVCGHRLQPYEDGICLECLLHLPLTGFKAQPGNPTELQLSTIGTRLVRASSFIYYHHNGAYARIFQEFKYRHNPLVARAMGRLMAHDLLPTGFFSSIQAIIPVPLTRKREAERGYNQCIMIGQGIEEVTGIPIREGVLVRKHFKGSQTHLSPEERKENVENAFALKHPESIAGCHVLVLDDVITYGHTLRACISELLQAEGCTVSVLTLGTSRTIHHWKLPEHIHPWD